MAQFARPISVISNSFNWSHAHGAASIPEAIDEEIADDNDYMETGGMGSITQIGLSGVTDPGLHTGHIMRCRICTPIVSVQLRRNSDSGNSIACVICWTHITTGWDDYSYTLSEAEAAEIDDYSGLFFSIQMHNGNPIYISWMELEVAEIPPSIISLDSGVIQFTGGLDTPHVDEPHGGYIELDGYYYRVSQKNWRPAMAPLVSTRFLQDGRQDSTWFAKPQYIFQGEIVAPVAVTNTDYGTIETLNITLAKREKLQFVDNWGTIYQVAFMGPSSGRSLAAKWDGTDNVFYVSVQLKGIKGALPVVF
jgi:hypothetical protein